ncbi:MAG: ABC transporter permease [Candidatus Rokuibacteriota bacterium]
MRQFVIQRGIQSVFLILLVTVLTFALVRLAPGGPSILMNPDLSAAQREEVRRNLGLDQPVAVQYARWLANLARGDLGVSYTYGTAVGGVVLERLPATLLLTGAAFVLAVVLALPLGIVAALKRNTALDYAAMLVTVVGVSVPIFWLGILAIIVFAVQLRWFPSGGMYTVSAGASVSDVVWHLVLPALVLSTYYVAQLARYVRSSMVEVVRADYVRTARAKGLGEVAVIGRHALRNALIPVVTVAGLLLPRMVGGAALTESVFAWPGIGRLAVDAAHQSDYPLILGVTLLISVVVIVGNAVTDALYSWVDPRIRLR